jgi:hypothetical protein
MGVFGPSRAGIWLAGRRVKMYIGLGTLLLIIILLIILF